MERLTTLLSTAMSRAGIVRQVSSAQIVQAGNEALERLLGDGVLLHARCVSFVEGRLCVSCRNATLGEEIRMQQDAIITDVIRKAPRASIERVSIQYEEAPRDLYA
ncbi:DUF721 domain-containing protein [Candidatus Uhrbacteria bacterium]|nr:DUF721 domain-containing protein [Candidatus Uhrbacteria bacterium]